MKRTLILVAAMLLVATSATLFYGVGEEHWLTRHGRISCEGKPLDGAALYRSRQGDLFAAIAPGSEGMPAVNVSEHVLLRCNTPAFTTILGVLHSKEADPASQCTTMWKGGGMDDKEPPHIVTDHYSEFPWGSCAKIRLEY